LYCELAQPTCSVSDELTADPAPILPRPDEETADVVPKHPDETHDCVVLFCHPAFGLREVYVPHERELLKENSLAQEWVTSLRGLEPDRSHGVEVSGSSLSDHHGRSLGFIAGCLERIGPRPR